MKNNNGNANQNKANMNWLNSDRDFDTHIYMNSAWRAINKARQAVMLKQAKIDKNQSPWFSGRNIV